MSKPKTPRKLLTFDAARYLTDDAAVAEYMTAVLETNDPDFLLLALGDVARARIDCVQPCPPFASAPTSP